MIAADTRRSSTGGLGDEYETPSGVVRYMVRHVARANAANDVVWEPFAAPSDAAARVMRAEGVRVVSRTGDFFAVDTAPAGTTLIVSNPPFSRKREVLQRLVRDFADVPCVLVLPLATLGTAYFSALFGALRRPWQVVVPPARIRYCDARGAQVAGSPTFHSVFLCVGRHFAASRLTLIAADEWRAAMEAADGASSSNGSGSSSSNSSDNGSSGSGGADSARDDHGVAPEADSCET